MCRGMPIHWSWTRSRSSFMLLVASGYVSSLRLRWCHKCSIGLRSGICAGQSIIPTKFSLNQGFANLDVCFGSFFSPGLPLPVRRVMDAGLWSRGKSPSYFHDIDPNRIDVGEVDLTGSWIYVRSRSKYLLIKHEKKNNDRVSIPQEAEFMCHVLGNDCLF